MTTNYDVIVAGGGPAGLSAAQTASAEGLNVLLLELQAQIGKTQTSIWIPENILDEKFASSVSASVNKTNLHSEHRDIEIEGNFGKIVDGEILNRLLALEAVKKGTEIWVGSPVKELLEENGTVQGVKSEVGEWSEEVRSKVVIDATGANAEWSSLFLRKILDSNWDKEKTVQTSEYLMANVSGKNEVNLYFSSIFAPRGYAWIHSLGQRFATAGIQGLRIHPDSALDEFIGRENPEPLTKSVPVGAYRGRLPIEGPLEKTTADGILAVGGSAGQIYSFSGHGTKYALEGGQIAGKVAAEAIEEKDTTEEKLAEYEELWKNKFEKEIQAGKILQSALKTSPDKKIDALLEILEENPELQKNFVNMFLPKNLEKTLKNFFKNDDCKRIFGNKKSEKILSL